MQELRRGIAQLPGLCATAMFALAPIPQLVRQSQLLAAAVHSYSVLRLYTLVMLLLKLLYPPGSQVQHTKPKHVQQSATG